MKLKKADSSHHEHDDSGQDVMYGVDLLNCEIISNK